MNVWQILIKGGPVMWPILLCSLVSLALFIEKISYFSSISTDVYALKSKVFEFLKQNRLKDAIILCEQDPSPVAKIIKAGIVKHGSGREEIKEAMEDVSHFEIPRLERNLQALMTIVHLSPLLGLLGTMTGITSSFYSIQVRSAAMNPVTPGDIAGGIGRGAAQQCDVDRKRLVAQPLLTMDLHHFDEILGGGFVQLAALKPRIDEGTKADLGDSARPPGGDAAIEMRYAPER